MCGMPGGMVWWQPGQRYVLSPAEPGTARTSQSPSGPLSRRALPSAERSSGWGWRSGRLRLATLSNGTGGAYGV